MSLGISKATASAIWHGKWDQFQQVDADKWHAPALDFNKRPSKEYTPIFNKDNNVTSDEITVETDSGFVFRVTRTFKKPFLHGTSKRQNAHGYHGFMRSKRKGVPKNIGTHVKSYKLDIGYRPQSQDPQDVQQDILWGDEVPDPQKAYIAFAFDDDQYHDIAKKLRDGLSGIHFDSSRMLNNLARRLSEKEGFDNTFYYTPEPAITYPAIPHFFPLRTQSGHIQGISRDFIFDNGFGWNVKLLFTAKIQAPALGDLFQQTKDVHAGALLTDGEFIHHLKAKSLLDSRMLAHRIVMSPITITQEWLEDLDVPEHDFSHEELAPLEDDPEAFIDEWGRLISADEAITLRRHVEISERNFARLSGLFKYATGMEFLRLANVSQAVTDIEAANHVLEITQSIPNGTIEREAFKRAMFGINEMVDKNTPQSAKIARKADQSRLASKRGKLTFQAATKPKWWPIPAPEKIPPTVHLSSRAPDATDAEGITPAIA